jgi:hypothetical protein
MKRFYLSEDPIEELPSGILTHVYGADKPRFFASVSRLDDSVPLQSIAYLGISFMFYFRAPDDAKAYAYLLRVTDNIDDAVHHDMLDILKETAEWYMDARALQADADEVEIGWLKPFSTHLNGFQILEHVDNGTCLLNFALGCQGFKDTDSALKFLEDGLGIERKLIYTGGLKINR